MFILLVKVDRALNICIPKTGLFYCIRGYIFLKGSIPFYLYFEGRFLVKPGKLVVISILKP